MRPSLWIAISSAVLLLSTTPAVADTTPTRSEFETRVTDLLADRPGADFTDAAVRYVKCPAAGLSHDRAYGSQQGCRYEFGTKSRRTSGGVDFFDNFGGGGEFLPSRAPSVTFVLAPRACTGGNVNAGFSDPHWRIRSLRATHNDTDSCRTAGQVLDRLATSAHGASRLPRHRTVRSKYADPGYAALDNWACSRTGTRSQTITCRDALNHRIIARLEPTD